MLSLDGRYEKRKAPVKTQKAIRSRSPTLRKTETQDVFRTFVDYPENQGAGGVFFANEHILTNDYEQPDETQRQVQYSNVDNDMH